MHMEQTTMNNIYQHTRHEAHHHLFEYIEVFCNNTRLHSSLAYHTPKEILHGINNKKAA